MVNHLTGHSPVNANIFASDESRFFARKEKQHVGNIERIPDAARRLLSGIGAIINFEIRIDPTR